MRVLSFDVLRIVAIYAVVAVHAAAEHFHNSFPSSSWESVNIYDSMVRWAVPVFIMISGALFLDPAKPLSIRRLYSKNIVRICCAYLFWSVIYQLPSLWAGTDIKHFVAGVIKGPYHFWFLKMIIGLYVAVPVLRLVVANKKVEIYFLLVALVTSSLVPMLIQLTEGVYPALGAVLSRFNVALGIRIAAGYTGYFVLGHFLNTYRMSARTRHLFYGLAVASVMVVAAGTSLLAHLTGRTFVVLYGYTYPFTVCEAVAVFGFVISRDFSMVSKSVRQWIVDLSATTFGIYLVHYYLIGVFRQWGVTATTLHPSYFLPIYCLGIFLISYAIVKLLRLIPLLRKYVL